ncbi:protein O-mannosyl-transferase family [Bacteroidota bacterium]
MIKYRKLNNYTGWLVFIIATLVYFLTLEPTTSFWDCGEYIATAYKLQVGHPPGAPFFQILGRFFSLFAFGDVSQVALMINTMSALSSSFTILFLFWTITHLSRKIVVKDKEISSNQSYTILAAGVIGSLAYTFSDSFWFSAVEGEVYAMSSFFTAVVFWAALKWEEVADEKHADRWLILIAYLIGLSIGVHLLNLLAIPAITLIYFFKKYNKHSIRNIIIALLVSFVILAGIMFGIIPETISLFANTEMIFVNTFGLPFNTGTIFFFLLIVSLLVLAIRHTSKPSKKLNTIVIILGALLALFFILESDGAGSFFFRIIIAAAIAAFFYFSRKRKAVQQSVILGIVFILIGYSSFVMLVIRSNANTPINENSPKDAISLLSYLNREQYGTWPILSGQYYNAPVVEREDGNPTYIKDYAKKKYVISNKKKGEVPVFDKKYTTFFPRMWDNSEPRYAQQYKKWAGIKSDPDNKAIPKFGENLRFFWNYQVKHMYWRYLMWNFVGRQNDIQGHGDLVNGNWLSGIKFIDEWRLGPQDNLPDSMRNKARNTFYFLPLLLGLIGLYYQFKRNYKDGLVVTLLFFMTGLAIVVYLNQHAPQPRERDYAYAASFYAFAIWMGFGLISLVNLLSKVIKKELALAILFPLILIVVPINMASEGWDDHSRAGRYTALETAKNYLNSCAPNAIIFTNGDNDTFPLWYAQEVEGIRTDVRVCNLSLFNGDWYVDQMGKKVYDSERMPFSLTKDKYRQGTRDAIYLVENEKIKDYVDVKELFDIIKDNEDRLKLRSGNEVYDYFPTKKFKIKADSATVMQYKVLPEKYADQIEDVKWKIDAIGISKSQIMLLDFLAQNNWERPVYFSITTGDDAYMGLQDYFMQEGMAYKLVPARIKSPDHQISAVNTDAMYDNLMNKFTLGLKGEHINVNEDNYRASMNMRNIYSRLAKALILENKLDSAELVADRLIEIVPDEAVLYDFFMVPVAEVYYDCGANEKGDAILQRLYEITKENLQYYFRFTGSKAEKIDQQRQHNLAMMREVYTTAEKEGREEIAKEAKSVFDTYYQRYIGGPY